MTRAASLKGTALPGDKLAKLRPAVSFSSAAAAAFHLGDKSSKCFSQEEECQVAEPTEPGEAITEEDSQGLETNTKW